MLNTPILLIVFNRPNHTQRVFDQIKKVKPQYLFVAADGPRTHKSDDAEKCKLTRQIINQVDWECKLYTLYRDQNRGCGLGPAEAISWFFSHVEQGIILEDDCVPDLSFFEYCTILLERYKNDPSVFMISGTNVLKSWRPNRSAYFFSLMGQSLGWATWRRAWDKFDYQMDAWNTVEAKIGLRQTLRNDTYFKHFSKEFDRILEEKPTDVWDFQWLFARWLHGGKTLVPSLNLVSNIGFDKEATHSSYQNDPIANLPLYSMRFPLNTPLTSTDALFDWYVFERFISTNKRSIFKKVSLKTVQLLHKNNIIA